MSPMSLKPPMPRSSKKSLYDLYVDEFAEKVRSINDPEVDQTFAAVRDAISNAGFDLMPGSEARRALATILLDERIGSLHGRRGQNLLRAYLATLVDEEEGGEG